MCFNNGIAKQQQQAAAEARAAEEARQARITQGQTEIDNTFSGFNDGFYQGRSDAYSAYATPQVDEQYAKARKDLVYALANAGLTNSSVAATRLGDLERQYARQRVQVADDAQSYAAQTRSDVEGARSGLLTNLSSTGDATAAGNAAIQQARSLSINPSFSPLGTLFQNTAAGIGTGVAAANDASPVTRATGTRLYNTTGTGSARVVS